MRLYVYASAASCVNVCVCLYACLFVSARVVVIRLFVCMCVGVSSYVCAVVCK